MFNEFKVKDEFYNKYLEFYIERFVYTAIGIEKDQTLQERTLKKKNLLKAFSDSLEKERLVLDVCDIRDVGDIINREENVPEGFRRIHPFEDGNKRVAKTILNRNLLIQDRAPVIISEEDTDLYYKFINEKDYIGFAEFLEARSTTELTNMVALYKMLNNVPADMEATAFLKREKKLKENC